MERKTFSLCFFLKKHNRCNEKSARIYLRVTVEGQRAEISTNRTCDEPDKWNASAGRMTGTKESIKILNAHLQALQNKVYAIYKDLLQQDSEINVETIKNKLTGKNEKSKSIIEVFQQHNDQMKALLGTEYAPATYKRYKTSLDHTKEFIQWKFNKPDIDIKKLNYEFIADYEFYLKSVRKCGHNSTIKYLTNFRKIVSICVKKGWLVRDPFYGFKMTIKEVVRETLTQEELNGLVSKEFSTTRLNITRDVFLFSCYTGLAYVDVYNLKRSEIATGIDGNKWIFAQRKKTETPFHVPLLDIPLKILDRYNDHPQCTNEGRALPVWSNQKLNEYLKEIADVCGIKKKLTYHVARHTFATTITLNNGVPLETISKLLGHRNIKITQRYAKLLDGKISQDMQHLKQKLSNLK